MIVDATGSPTTLTEGSGKTPSVGDGEGRVSNLLEVLTAVSLANLIMLRVWALWPPYLGDRLVYFLPRRPTAYDYVLLVLEVAILGAAILLFRRQLRAVSGRIGIAARWGAGVIAIGLALNSVRSALANESDWLQLAHWQRVGVSERYVYAGVAGLVLGAVALGRRTWAPQIARYSLVLVSPLIVVQLLAAMTSLLRYERMDWTGRTTAPANSRRADAVRRVVVVLFDEFDYRLGFEARPAGIRLDAIDRLREEGYQATAARAPGASTLLAIPSLLMGSRVARVSVGGPSAICVGSERESGCRDLSSAEHLFRRIQRRGYASAIVGWYFPYCRLLADSTTGCQWYPADYMFASQPGRSVAAAMASDYRKIFEPRTMSLFWRAEASEAAIETNRSIETAAIQAATDPAYDFVYLHLPTTHWPYTYEAKSGQHRRKGDYYEGYEDSMVLADGLVTRLRAALDKKALTLRTAIVITSDHQFRLAALSHGKEDRRVPFIVWIPGAAGPWIEKGAIETPSLLSRTLGLLDGSIRTPSDLRSGAQPSDTGGAK